MDSAMLNRYDGLIKWISAAVIVVSLLVIAQTLPLNEMANAATEWIEELGVWGPVVYGLLYVVGTILFVPGSILTMAAGAVFGLLVGMITVSISATTGAMLAFLIARYLARNQVARLAERNPMFDAVDKAVGEGGWKVVALLRLSPALPFNVQNYLYGLTRIRFWPCLWATWLAMLPGGFLYVYIGHVAGVAVAGERERTVWEWGMLVVGLLATVVVTIYITMLAKRALREQTDLQDAAPQEEEENVKESSREDEQLSATPPIRKRPWGGALTLAAIAILAVAVAFYVQLNPDAVGDLFGATSWPESELGK